MTVHVKANNPGGEPIHDIYEGDAIMSQAQQDRFQALVGNGLAKVTVGRELSEKDYGNGGGVIVNVTITCDQNEHSIRAAAALAHEVADTHAWSYHRHLKKQLIDAGILTDKWTK